MVPLLTFRTLCCLYFEKVLSTPYTGLSSLLVDPTEAFLRAPILFVLGITILKRCRLQDFLLPSALRVSLFARADQLLCRRHGMGALPK
jgi:hypothetical protein